MSKVYSGTKFNERDPSQDEVRRLFEYDAETGNLIWRERPREDFKSDGGWKMFNSRDAGKVAGGYDGKRYSRIYINGKSYKSHRLIYILHHGPILKGLIIDHIDANPSNNRIDNLRSATRAENNRNRRKQSNNTSNIKGVSFHKASGKYRAAIYVNGKQISLGYGTLDHCAQLYQEAANKYHGEFAKVS